MSAGSLGEVSGNAPVAASSGAAPVVLNIANVGSQSGSDWADDSDSLLATWAASTTGVVGVNQDLWDDILIWDLSALFGEDILVSASPILALDWITETHPGEAGVVGFGFCTAANLAGAAIQTTSRWANIYNDGAGKEGIAGKRNQNTGQTATTKASPEETRITPLLQNSRWAYHLISLKHGDTGNNPHVLTQTPWDGLTGANKVFAWAAGGPASAAVGEVTWKGKLQVYYGGGRA